MSRTQWLHLEERAAARLRGMLEATVGPVTVTAAWLLQNQERWDRLCQIANHYVNSEPLVENWKDAEREWSDVHDAAQKLNVALENLGHLACAIRFDAGVKSPGLWNKVGGYLHSVPGNSLAPPVRALEWFSKLAAEECRRMKVLTNGARKEDESCGLAFMIHQLFDLLDVPIRPQAHARRIAAVIHAWATGDRGAVENPRFGERAAKRVQALRKHTQSPN